MDILNSIAIRIRCLNCGGAYLVPLSDVLLSHQLLHQGCPVAQETECPPPFQVRLRRQSKLSIGLGGDSSTESAEMAANWFGSVRLSPRSQPNRRDDTRLRSSPSRRSTSAVETRLRSAKRCWI